MKAIWRRYLNEIVGLTVMALMTIALVTAQAQATSDQAVDDAATVIFEVHVTLSE